MNTNQNTNVPVVGAVPQLVNDLFTITQRAERMIKQQNGAVVRDYYQNEQIKQAVTLLRLATENVIVKAGGAV